VTASASTPAAPPGDAVRTPASCLTEAVGPEAADATTRKHFSNFTGFSSNGIKSYTLVTDFIYMFLFAIYDDPLPPT